MSLRDDISVEPSLAADVPSVVALLEKASLPTAGVEDLDILLVARRGREVVGVAGIEFYPPQGLLRSVVVDPGLRHAGVGSMLVRAATEAAAEAGLRELVLLTTDAGPYFARFGFRYLDRSIVDGPVRRSTEFTTLCPDTAMAMRKPLAD